MYLFGRVDIIRKFQPVMPEFSEIMQSCISCNVFLWIVALILTIQFFCYDYSAGTIKLPIAYGIDRVKVYFAKVIVIVLYNAVCYFLFNAITLCFTCIQIGYTPNITELIQYFHSHAILKYFVWLNPLYYWMNMGTFRLQYGLINEIIVYFIFGLFFLLPLSVILVRKQEFK